MLLAPVLVLIGGPWWLDKNNRRSEIKMLSRFPLVMALATRHSRRLCVSYGRLAHQHLDIIITYKYTYIYINEQQMEIYNNTKALLRARESTSLFLARQHLFSLICSIYVLRFESWIKKIKKDLRDCF